MLQPIEELTRALARLPGLGRRSAGRAALALVRERERLAEPLMAALASAQHEVVCCSRCGGFTVLGEDPCAYCSDPLRDSSTVCVVEDSADIVTIEASGGFKGRYHVLGGKLSSARRVGLNSLRIAALQDRIVSEGFREVLLALSTDMDGDATTSYVAEILRGCATKDRPLHISRLAFGLPADSGVAYSDPLTLRRAITHRAEV